MKGICILLAYAAVMLLATVTLTRKEKGVEGFCVGDRNAGWLLSSLSIAATWVWALANAPDSIGKIRNKQIARW